MDEVRGKDRSITELESQVKKLAENGHKTQLREEVRSDQVMKPTEKVVFSYFTVVVSTKHKQRKKILQYFMRIYLIIIVNTER